MKRLSAPWGLASTRAMTRRSTVQLFADLSLFAREAAEGGVLGAGANLAQRHGVAGQTEDGADTLTLAPPHRFGAPLHGCRRAR